MDLHLSVDDPTPAALCPKPGCGVPICVTCRMHLHGEPGPECSACGPQQVSRPPYRLPEASDG